jgi:hypothetical protein
MLSRFAELDEPDKRLFVAKIIHNINYSQSSFETLQALVKMWDEYPRRQATFFTKLNQITNGTANN